MPVSRGLYARAQYPFLIALLLQGLPSPFGPPTPRPQTTNVFLKALAVPDSEALGRGLHWYEWRRGPGPRGQHRPRGEGEAQGSAHGSKGRGKQGQRTGREVWPNASRKPPSARAARAVQRTGGGGGGGGAVGGAGRGPRQGGHPLAGGARPQAEGGATGTRLKAHTAVHPFGPRGSVSAPGTRRARAGHLF